MTLATIIETLKMIALKHPNVNSAYEGNIYEILNSNPNNKYASVVITQQSHTTDEVYDHYGFVIFYVDRLVDDMEENRVQIQSCGKSMLGNIITFFCEEFEAECDNITYQPFTQKFVDMTCGVYCTITIDTVKDVYCPEEYWKEDWVTPVTVIRNQDKRVTFTENGTYTIDYDPTVYTGLGNVDVEVNIDVDSYYNNGYNQGKTDGINEQKSKLETINITENGTYTKEDGYSHIEVNVPDLNGDYNEGYEQGHTDGYNEGYTKGEGIGYNQGQADLAANARVLNVTENGTYDSKFSDPVIPTLVTGVYADGTDFYNYAELNGKVFNTNIPATMDSRVELWYKGDNLKSGDGYNNIISTTDTDNSNVFEIIYWASNNNNVRARIGSSYISANWDETKWHHIIVSVSDGFVIDGEKKGDIQSNSNIPNGRFTINGTYDTNSLRNANGCFGMIKIDNTIIIPTADGFLNTNTGKLLEVVKDGSYTYTENVPIYGEGELYKTINVNVLPKVNVKEAGLRFGNSSFKEIPEWADFEGITDMSYMFNSCRNLQTIPEINTSEVSDMSHMFDSCSNLQTIPLLNTSNVVNMERMFSNCNNLQTIPLLDTSNVANFTYCFYYTKIIELPQFDLRKGTTFYEFCYNCRDLKYVPNLDLSSATNINGLFENCNSLISVGEIKVPNVTGNVTYFLGGSNKNNLTDFGGLIGFRGSITTDGFHTCPNLSYQSCINILNGLYDFTGNGETPNSNEGKLKVHQNFLDKVGEEISIATNKGWTITV